MDPEQLRRVRISGDPSDRGRQLGEKAQEQVQASVDAYRRIFERQAGWDWATVRREAEMFVEPISRFDQRYTDEIRGTARGAGLDEIDVVAINSRTELLAIGTLGSAGGRALPPTECSAFARVPRGSDDEPTILGQNWDWLQPTADSLILLEVEREDGPDLATVVEAGLLAKLGLNSAGVGLVANALTCRGDAGTGGVPFHVLLRAVLDSSSIRAATEKIATARRASSANYLIADGTGAAIDVETAAEGQWIDFLTPEDGVLFHTNHYLSPRFRGADIAYEEPAHSFLRLARMRQLFGFHDAPRDPAGFQSVLADHAASPASLCSHGPAADPPEERTETLASAVMEPGAGRMHVALGNPCSSEFVLVEPFG